MNSENESQVRYYFEISWNKFNQFAPSMSIQNILCRNNELSSNLSYENSQSNGKFQHYCNNGILYDDMK